MSLWSSLQKKFAKSTVKEQMKSMPSQLFSIRFHGVLLRLDSWFLNAWGEQEKIKKKRKWWYLKWEVIFLQSGAMFANKSQHNISCSTFTELPRFVPANVSLKTAFCHRGCKGLDNIYTAGCAESRGVKLPKVKQHNCLPFLPQTVGK